MGAMTPEGKVKKAVKELLKKHDIWYFMPGNNGYGKSGIPDIIAIFDGRFVGIEVKADGGSVTKLQEARGKEIIDAGGIFHVVRGIEGVEALSLAITAEAAKWKLVGKKHASS